MFEMLFLIAGREKTEKYNFSVFSLLRCRAFQTRFPLRSVAGRRNPQKMTVMVVSGLISNYSHLKSNHFEQLNWVSM